MNKVAVITGGAGGIGQAVAERLAREKQNVFILDINDEAGAKVAAEFRKRGIPVAFLCVDVTQESEVQSAFDKIKAEHGQIDVLVNVAGGSMHRHPLDEFPLADWQAVIDANLTSTFLCCRAVTPIMKTQKSGSIVNISSDIAFSGDAGRSAYAAAKAGILGRDPWHSSSQPSAFASTPLRRDESRRLASEQTTPMRNGRPELREFHWVMPARRKTSPKPWLI